MSEHNEGLKNKIQNFLTHEIDSKVDSMTLVTMGDGKLTAKYVFDDEFCFIFFPDRVGLDHHANFSVEYDYNDVEIEKLNSINHVLLGKKEQDFKMRFLESCN